jgi:UDP-N-acetylmuramoyl-L-alanyl-D-glutamate--2,6-diaminopimelate ligase
MTTIARLLAAAEPHEPRPLTGLVDRLEAAGILRAVIQAAEPGANTGANVDPLAWSIAGGVTEDSRTVRQGGVFVAIPGAHVDGQRFVGAAAVAGAIATIVEQSIDPAPPGLVQIVVDRSRTALAEAAAWWYGDPSRSLGVIGITGTDGKTTTSLLAAAALAAACLPTGLIGTVVTQIGGIREPNPAHSTTPEAPQLQRALRAMVTAGDRAAIIETTSHGLALDRVAAIGYDVAILTNLSHEHLELHGTFEAYRAAKRSLFERLAVGPGNPAKPHSPWPRTGIVNVDDPSAETFAAATRSAGAWLVTYGRAEGADVQLRDVAEDGHGLRVIFRTPDGPGELNLRLAGRFNAHNALAVVALGRALGLDPFAVRAGLESVEAIPGRMERVDRGQPFDVVVDYAHSPASLELVLDELGAVASARGGTLIVVFGSAGERDREKRPMLGRVAAERCRVVVITDEDPRAEDRAAILGEIAAGARSAPGRPEVILEIADRRTAIGEALALARPGDIVLLAGKGHETTILYADRAEPWNERAEAESALAALGWGA